MKPKMFDELLSSLKEAKDIAQNKKEPSKRFVFNFKKNKKSAKMQKKNK